VGRATSTGAAGTLGLNSKAAYCATSRVNIWAPALDCSGFTAAGAGAGWATTTPSAFRRFTAVRAAGELGKRSRMPLYSAMAFSFRALRSWSLFLGALERASAARTADACFSAAFRAAACCSAAFRAARFQLLPWPGQSAPLSHGQAVLTQPLPWQAVPLQPWLAGYGTVLQPQLPPLRG